MQSHYTPPTNGERSSRGATYPAGERRRFHTHLRDMSLVGSASECAHCFGLGTMILKSESFVPQKSFQRKILRTFVPATSKQPVGRLVVLQTGHSSLVELDRKAWMKGRLGIRGHRRLTGTGVHIRLQIAIRYRAKILLWIDREVTAQRRLRITLRSFDNILRGE